MTSIWSIVLTSSLAATIVGLLIAKVRSDLARDRKAASILHGMLLEIRYAKECADEYLTKSATKPLAPAWRLATAFYTDGIAWLAAERVLEDDDVRALHRLFVSVSEVNRCLDLIEDYRHVSVPPEEAQPKLTPELVFAANETGRIRKKCQHVLERLPAAKQAVENRLREFRWRDFRS
jgi:hypothetical protein